MKGYKESLTSIFERTECTTNNHQLAHHAKGVSLSSQRSRSLRVQHYRPSKTINFWICSVYPQTFTPGARAIFT